MKIRPPDFAVGDDKKRGKGGKVHKVISGLYFSYLGSRPLWTDFEENLQDSRGRRRNHSFHYFGFDILGGLYTGSKFPFSHYFACHHYNSFAAAAAFDTDDRPTTDLSLGKFRMAIFQ